METRNKTIILTGGGSGGPVTPLLALYPSLKERGYAVAWIGTKQGIEKNMVAAAGIAYYGIAAGKLRRYFSMSNIIDPFRILTGFFQSLGILSRLRPSLIVTAGGFVSVPVVWAAWALRIKVIVHQQDILPGLANRLMAPFADAVTVTFEKSLKDFGSKAVLTGNPVREEFVQVKSRKLKVESQKYRLLILGGGTGATAINQIVHNSLPELLKVSVVVHVTGKYSEFHDQAAGYHQYEFLDASRMAEEMSRADLIVTRAGLGTLTELSYLGRPALIIPMPQSHQEDNAKYFEGHGAAMVMAQDKLDPQSFINAIQGLLEDQARLASLSEGITSMIPIDGNENLVKRIVSLLGDTRDSILG